MRLLLYSGGSRRFPLTRLPWISRQWLSTVTGGKEEGGKDEVVLSPRPPLTRVGVGSIPFDTHTVYKQFQGAGKIYLEWYTALSFSLSHRIQSTAS